MAAFPWSIADLLRGNFKQSQYGRIILPFKLPRRMECVLAPTRDEVIKQTHPFPELEYYFLYLHIEAGGLLILDDIHIPTIDKHQLQGMKQGVRPAASSVQVPG